MIKIEKRGFGYRLFFSGILKIADLNQFKAEIMKDIENSKEPFSIYIDLRGIRYLAKEAQHEYNALRSAPAIQR